jgi:hypothetical protein
MRKTLLLFTTMALALLLAAGMAWATDARPTVSSTAWVVPNTTPLLTGTIPPETGVNKDANITVTFSEAMKAGSINTNTFYLLEGNFTAKSQTQNPKKFCTTVVTPPATSTTLKPCPPTAVIAATVTLDATAKIATLNPNSTLNTGPTGTKYTVVVEGTQDNDNVAVKDTGGTPLLTAGTGDYIFHFTTAAPPAT